MTLNIRQRFQERAWQLAYLLTGTSPAGFTTGEQETESAVCTATAEKLR